MVEMQAVADLIAGLDVVADMSGFDPQKTFRDNGIDSLDVMSVFLAVEETYAVKFSDEESQRIRTPAALCAALNARL